MNNISIATELFGSVEVFREALVQEMIRCRKEKNMSHHELDKLCGLGIFSRKNNPLPSSCQFENNPQLLTSGIYTMVHPALGMSMSSFCGIDRINKFLRTKRARAEPRYCHHMKAVFVCFDLANELNRAA
jgi:hypothetical protein